MAHHPAVADVAVVGMPHEYWGEAIHAFVVLQNNDQVSEEELLEYCSPRLARFKFPKTVRFVPSLPRNASGKLLRKELQSAMRGM